MSIRHGIAVLSATAALTTGMVGAEAAPTNPSMIPPSISAEMDTYVTEFGLLDLGALATASVLQVEPKAVKKSLMGVDQTMSEAVASADQGNVWFATGFNIVVGGLNYTVTAGHVAAKVNGEPLESCNNQAVTSRTVSRGRLLQAIVSGRYGTFDGNSTDYINYNVRDLGVLRLPDNQRRNRLMGLEIRPEDDVIQPGTILYDTNYEPVFVNGQKEQRDMFSLDKEISQPNEMVGIVLGKFQNTKSNQNLYAVLIFKSYNSQDAIYGGASGSPFQLANGYVVGGASSITSLSTQQIAHLFGTKIEGPNLKSTYTVVTMQAFDSKDIAGYIGKIKPQNCTAQN